MNPAAASRRMRPLRAAWFALALGMAALAHATGDDPSRWDRLDADEPAPAFALTDHNGGRFALADLRGQVAVVTFLFTHCTDVCPVLPVMLARVDDALTAAERTRVRFVGISVDPRRDTPAQLRKFLRERSLHEARWTLLTGSVAEATRVAADYGVVVRPDARTDLVHNTVFVLVDARGRLRTEFHGLATPTAEIVRALRGLLAEPGR